MEAEAQPIAALPAQTTSLLRSSLVIPSLPSILVELVQNALDAQANAIDLFFDLERWAIKIDDNGSGLSREDLRRVGGERYLTSKLGEGGMGTVETFGFRGEALASIADVAMLEVLTQPRRGDGEEVGEGQSYSLVLRGGKRLFDGVAKTKRNSSGTTIWVRDIFYKWPVRRRPLSTPSARLSLVASLRQCLSTISLLHPLVSFSLTDTSSASSASKRLISVARSKEGVLGRWRQLWGRAGVEKAVEFERQEGTEGEFGASGFFSLTASHSKANQFIYVNCRPLAPSPLHKLINAVFSQSSFSRHAGSHLVAPTSSPTGQGAGTKASRKSPKKVAERHPIFVLNLRAPPGMIDVTLEPEKRVVEFEDTVRVHAFVEDVVKTFLRDQGFLSAAPPPADLSPTKSASAAIGPASRTAVESPSKKQKTLSQLMLPTSQAQSPLPASAFHDTPVDLQGPILARRIIDKTNILVAYPPPHDSPQLPANCDNSLADSNTSISWTDPSTLQTFLIDSRTGNSWRPREGVPTSSKACCGCEEGGRRAEKPGMVDRSALRKRTRTSLEEEEECGEETPVPAWMAKTLQNWENPVFASGPSLIPSLPAVPLSTDPSLPQSRATTTSDSLTRSRTSLISSFFRTTSTTTIHSLPTDLRGAAQTFSKASLRDAEFVAQVDRKFLLVRLRTTPSEEGSVESLVMVDQHAADERVRVERFLGEVCGRVARGEEVEKWEFGEAVPVLVSRAEAVELRGRESEFARWGIGIACDGVAKGEEGDYVQVYVRTVPLVVSDRLRVEPKLLQELVRSYLAQLVEGPRRAGTERRKVEGEGERSWGAVVRECPPVLLDLINSKACRGAIMFNDALTPTQCKKLLAQLAETTFPFQCAHGRPSLVPVVNLADSTLSARRGAGKQIDWSRLAQEE